MYKDIRNLASEVVHVYTSGFQEGISACRGELEWTVSVVDNVS
jgi:hypothetical protein